MPEAVMHCRPDVANWSMLLAANGGILAALLLVVPVFHLLRLRQALELIGNTDHPDPDTRRELDRAARAIRRRLRQKGWIGTAFAVVGTVVLLLTLAAVNVQVYCTWIMPG